MASELMLVPEAHLGLGIASEMLVEPLAQVPLLRSSQRDLSIQDIVRATTGSARKTDTFVGRETLQVAGTLTQAET